jgi:hypothetical protein
MIRVAALGFVLVLIGTIGRALCMAGIISFWCN